MNVKYYAISRDDGQKRFMIWNNISMDLRLELRNKTFKRKILNIIDNELCYFYPKVNKDFY